MVVFNAARATDLPGIGISGCVVHGVFFFSLCCLHSGVSRLYRFSDVHTIKDAMRASHCKVGVRILFFFYNLPMHADEGTLSVGFLYVYVYGCACNCCCDWLDLRMAYGQKGSFINDERGGGG